MIFWGASSAELHLLVEATEVKIIGAELMEDKWFQNDTPRTSKVWAGRKFIHFAIVKIHIFINRHILIASFIYF